MIYRDESELEKVLDSLFPRGRGSRPSLVRKGLGEWDDFSGRGERNSELVAYGGDIQRQMDGMAGQGQAALAGIDRSKCPPWLTPECLEVLSRMIEGTFRNFQQHSRLPSHVSPPFSSRIIDAFPSTATVNIPASGGYVLGTYVNVASFSMPADCRGVIVAAGQAMESAAAFQDTSWRITVDTEPFDPYIDCRMQLWDFLHPTPIQFIGLKENQQVILQCAPLSPASHTAIGRLVGWFYPVRSEEGDNIRSTIVD